jgi:hypothetical protein
LSVFFVCRKKVNKVRSVSPTKKFNSQNFDHLKKIIYFYTEKISKKYMCHKICDTEEV